MRKPFFISQAICFSSLLVLPMSYAGEIHEWGTFTTVSGSDGKLLTGLHWEEEKLPPFVHSHSGTNYYDVDALGYAALGTKFGAGKGMSYNYNLKNVTVKMETPVLYFYGDKPESYNVKVNFNNGTISQWYPQRKSGDKLPKLEIDKKTLKFPTVDFAKPYKGSIEWDVDVIPRKHADQALTFKHSQTLTWSYPRVSSANMLKVGDQYEDYLFYRGIGNFDIPVSFTVDRNETLKIENKAEQAIPFAIAFENIQHGISKKEAERLQQLFSEHLSTKGGSVKYAPAKVRYKTFSQGIASASSVSVSESDWKTCDAKNWRATVFKEIRDGLLQQGLTLDESDAMVKTWWKSYFEESGLRVFWVVPEKELNKILPIKVEPQPEKMVRVLVGRSDIFRPRFEKKLVDDLENGKFHFKKRHRYFEPMADRLRDLVTVPYYGELNKGVLMAQGLHVRTYADENPDKDIKRDYYTFTENSYLIDKKSVLKRYVTGNHIQRLEWEILNPNQMKIGEKIYTWNKEKNILVSPKYGEKGLRNEIKLPLLLSK